MGAVVNLGRLPGTGDDDGDGPAGRDRVQRFWIAVFAIGLVLVLLNLALGKF